MFAAFPDGFMQSARLCRSSILVIGATPAQKDAAQSIRLIVGLKQLRFQSV
jgi:hypothetical protein